eukprot:scaffold60864_cov30-Phaeocystis_antarctica.AAC.1
MAPGGAHAAADGGRSSGTRRRGGHVGPAGRLRHERGRDHPGSAAARAERSDSTHRQPRGTARL